MARRIFIARLLLICVVGIALAYTYFTSGGGDMAESSATAGAVFTDGSWQK